MQREKRSFWTQKYGPSLHCSTKKNRDRLCALIVTQNNAKSTSGALGSFQCDLHTPAYPPNHRPSSTRLHQQRLMQGKPSPLGSKPTSVRRRFSEPLRQGPPCAHPSPPLPLSELLLSPSSTLAAHRGCFCPHRVWTAPPTGSRRS